MIVFAAVVVLAAQLTTNLAANVVSPANDFSDLSPRRIGYGTGGLITAVIGIAMMPWRLYADAAAYIFTWLVGYSSVMGAVGGILIADYWIVRRRQLLPDELLRENGAYTYRNGVNWRAVTALVAAVVPVVPGFARAAVAPGGSVPDPNLFDRLYAYGWFVTFGLSFVGYLALMRRYTVAMPPRPSSRSRVSRSLSAAASDDGSSAKGCGLEVSQMCTPPHPAVKPGRQTCAAVSALGRYASALSSKPQMNGGSTPQARAYAESWPRWCRNSSLMTWNATQPGQVWPQGVGTMAESCASPMRSTAALACSKHRPAKAMIAAFPPSSAASLGSAPSSAVIRPFATPSAMSRTTDAEMWTDSSAGERMPGMGCEVNRSAGIASRSRT